MSDAVISYAALILADAGLDVTADNLLALTKAAGASVENVWADVFAKALEGKDLKEILSGFHAAGSGAAPAAGAAATGSTEAAAEEAAPEEAEESDDDMGFGLFD